MNSHLHAYIQDFPDPFDITIVGAGILGTSVASWISSLYGAERVAVVEKEHVAGHHASSRNTGVVHRPFYLHPSKKKVYARAAIVSYNLWKDFAKKHTLPWRTVGTMEVATNERGMSRLRMYAEWAKLNGMCPGEVQILTRNEARAIEPHVECVGALLVSEDAAVDFGVFTKHLRKDSMQNGLNFFVASELIRATAKGDFLECLCSNGATFKTRFLVNCAGGGALTLARRMGLGREYAELYFRGEYRSVDSLRTYFSSRNIYSVPEHEEYPFLDPHWIVRWNGTVDIGPSAVPVMGPYAYHGFIGDRRGLWARLTQPVKNRVRAVGNRTFIELACTEWKNSLSRTAVTNRIRKFLPLFEKRYLSNEKAASGIRSVLVDKNGEMVNEAVILHGARSIHVLNYNSPGATGAPAFAAMLVLKMMQEGRLAHMQRSRACGAWRFEDTIRDMLSPAAPIISH